MHTTTRPLAWISSLMAFAVLLLTGCSPRPVEILAVSGPDSLLTNESGTFSATINEEAKPPVTYEWQFGDNASAQGNPAYHTYNEAGSYTVTVTASNRKGKSQDTGQTSVIVYDPPVPAQVITILAEPMNPDTRTEVRFGANVRGDVPLTYRWDFGDGTTDTGAAPIHVFDEPGVYTIALEVENDAGSDRRTLSLTVEPFEADYCTEIAEMNAAYFERNSSILSASAEATLRDNLTILQDCPNMNVRVEGWTGPYERNPQLLSDDRARAVQQFYINNGVTASRIQTEGRGRVSGSAKKSGGDQFQRADTIPLR